MTTAESRNLMTALRIEQAEKAVHRVEFCLANDQPEIAANRIYYGMFYATIALASLRGYESSKHHQMIGWFNKNFVHTDIFPKRFTAIIKKAFDARMDADYEVNEVPPAADLEAMFADMKTFISTIKDWIEANPA